jgi:hypothetical protein
MSHVPIEQSPSLLSNNLTASSGVIAYIHKDAICTLSTSVFDGRPSEPSGCPSDSPTPDPSTACGVTQVAMLTVGHHPLLVTTSRTFVAVYRGVHASSGEVPVNIARIALDDAGCPEGEAASQFFRGLAACAHTEAFLVGTSWGEVLTVAVTTAVPGPGTAGLSIGLRPALARGLRGAVAAIAADERFIVAGDDLGSVAQWDAGSGALLIRHDNGSGSPLTAVALRGDIIVAGFGSGHLRLFRAGERYCAAEITAHTRPVSGLDWARHIPSFASCGEDGVLSLWSMPELGLGPLGGVGMGAGNALVVLDATTRVPNAVLTGVAFVSAGGGKGGPVHVVAAAYDSHHLTVLMGLR